MSNLKLSMEVWPNMPWGRLEICGCAVNSWGNIPLNELVYKVKEHGYEGMDIIYSKIAQIPPEEKTGDHEKDKRSFRRDGCSSSVTCSALHICYTKMVRCRSGSSDDEGCH